MSLKLANILYLLVPRKWAGSPVHLLSIILFASCHGSGSLDAAGPMLLCCCVAEGREFFQKAGILPI